MAALASIRLVKLECGHQMNTKNSHKAPCHKCDRKVRKVTHEVYEEQWVTFAYAKYQRILKDLDTTGSRIHCEDFLQNCLDDGLTEEEAFERVFTLYASIQESRSQNRQARKLAAAQSTAVDGYSCPDDSKYRPKYIDPVLRGVGRVTGQTAKAVLRKKTMNKVEHDS